MTSTTRRLNGPAVRVIRELNGINLSEFAKRVETSTAFLSRLETGARQPSPAVMLRIAAALGVALEVVSYPTLPQEVAA